MNHELFENYTLKMLKSDSKQSLRALKDYKADIIHKRLIPVYNRSIGTIISLFAVTGLIVMHGSFV